MATDGEGTEEGWRFDPKANMSSPESVESAHHGALRRLDAPRERGFAVSRPTATFAEVRATRRAVAALAVRVDRVILAVEHLRDAAPSTLGRPEDVMRILGISRAALWRRVKDGSILCNHVGRSDRFDLAALVPKHGCGDE